LANAHDDVKHSSSSTKEHQWRKGFLLYAHRNSKESTSNRENPSSEGTACICEVVSA
jgi:hypothetical protein